MTQRLSKNRGPARSRVKYQQTKPKENSQITLGTQNLSWSVHNLLIQLDNLDSMLIKSLIRCS